MSACVVGTIDRLCFLHWVSTPYPSDARAALAAATAARRAVGASLVVIAVIDEGIRRPGIQAAREILRMMPALDRLTESHYVVVLGDGIGVRVKRGIMAALSAAVVNPVTITGSVEDALAAACARLKLDARVVHTAALARGFLPEAALR